MVRATRFFRIKEIGLVLAKYDLIPWVPTTAQRVLGYAGTGESNEQNRKMPIGQKLRRSFEELGTTYIKLGQILSLRKDILPDEITDELKKLQDRVSPIDFDEMKPIIERNLCAPITDIFSEFDEKPLAAASISQVYRAVLKKGGAEVVVKVRKPGIVETIQSDLEMLKWLAEMMQNHSQLGESFDFVGIVDEFFSSMEMELDFLIEMRNTRRFAKNFAAPEWDWLMFPKIYDEYSTKRMLVMEYIHGRKIDEIHDPAFTIDRHLVAKNGAKSFMKQIFEDGFFHADLHAGNFFFLDNNRLAVFDCGMAGTIDRYTREMFAEMLIAFAKKDYVSLASLYAEISDSPIAVNKKQLARDIRRITESLPETLVEVDMSELFSKVMGVLYRHKLRIPKNFTLLIRGASMLEGLGRDLVPDFNFIHESQELASVVINAKYSPERVRENLYYLGMRLLDMGKTLPLNLSEIIEKLENGNLKLNWEFFISGRDRLFISKLVTRIVTAFMLTGLLISFGTFNGTPYLYIIYLPLALFSTIAFILTFRKDRKDRRK
ncbi:MAG TPA: AarF/ABC1/UbiB kinase family protein [bacterium]|nr:AarF/ABC1/UbiB kinase family protein [bacterium]